MEELSDDLLIDPLLLVGLMGVTGAGKSTFVLLATGDSSVKVDHTLEAYAFLNL